MKNNYGTYLDGSGDTLKTAELRFDNTIRFAKRDAGFFSYLQSHQNHSGVFFNGIYTYSFSDQPEILQPSGTSNFSLIEHVNFNIETNQNNLTGTMHSVETSLFMYTQFYDILKVSNGLAGLIYSN
jgi:hypothetical protein